MEAMPVRRVTPRDRVDAIGRLTADQLGPQLLRDRRLAHIVPSNDGIGLTLFQISGTPDAWLEPLKCSWALTRGAHLLGLDSERTKAVKSAALTLRRKRNDHSHEKLTKAEEARAVRDIAEASKVLLGLYGLVETQKHVDHLALPPSIVYVEELRDFLIAAASTGMLVTYEEARAVLDLPDDALGFRILFRQLNVLAAKQIILGEPQLCALVVDSKTSMPGPGFYWVADLDREAADSVKQTAHEEMVRQVRAYDWSL